MRILIAIPACCVYDYGDKSQDIPRETEGRLDSIRATWANQVPEGVDLRFFYGRGPVTLLPDEIQLQVPDDYKGLSYKFQGMCRYALEHDYEFIFCCGDDTYVFPDRLLASNFRSSDYSGNYPWNCPNCYIPGGTGIFLSRRAMKLIVDAPVTHWSDDLWVGGVLKAAGIEPRNLSGFVSGFDAHYAPLPLPAHAVTAHAVKPVDMLRIYQGQR